MCFVRYNSILVLCLFGGWRFVSFGRWVACGGCVRLFLLIVLFLKVVVY